MPFEAPKCDACETLPVQFVCPKCEESYCKSCDEKLHSRSAKFRQHERHPYSGVEKNVDRFCQIKGHKDVSISLLCLDCNKLICSNCLLKEHKPHETVTLREGMEKTIENLKLNINPVEEQQKRIEIEIENKKKRIKNFRRRTY